MICTRFEFMHFSKALALYLIKLLLGGPAHALLGKTEERTLKTRQMGSESFIISGIFNPGYTSNPSGKV